MVFIMIYPAVAMLAMFIVLVIMLILKFGDRWCGLRHSALPDEKDWEEKAFEQKVSYA